MKKVLKYFMVFSLLMLLLLTFSDRVYAAHSSGGGSATGGTHEGKPSENYFDDSKGMNNLIEPAGDFACSDVSLLTGIWLFIRIFSPFLVVLLGSLDFLKAVMANDEKKMKEAKGKFLKRVIAFILLILLPFVVQLIFETAGTYGSQNMCLLKCIATNDTSSKGCD